MIVAPANITDIGIPGFGIPIHGRPTEIAAQLASFSGIGIAEVHTYLWPQSTAAIEAIGLCWKLLTPA